jgi:hypothetical protein
MGAQSGVEALDGLTTVTARLSELAFLFAPLWLVMGRDLTEFLFLRVLVSNRRLRLLF